MKQKQKLKSTNQEIIDAYDYLSSAASTQDCTGLIPSAPKCLADLESYEAIYPYQPPKVTPKEAVSKAKCLKKAETT